MAENNRKHNFNRILAALCVILIAIMQVVVIVPDVAFAGGGNLEIKVQYAAEPGAKIRTKATLTRGQLSAMSSTYCYSNVTSVGTVMVMKARGPKITSILNEAGIDVNSVKLITFETSDGYTRNFSRSQFTASGYYYPKLNLKGDAEIEEEPEEEPTEENTEETTVPSAPDTPDKPEPEKPDPTEPSDGASMLDGISASIFEPVYGTEEETWMYERASNGTSIIPKKGFDAGAKSVPVILAVEFGSTKAKGKKAESLSMNTSQTYRYCMGQTRLSAGKQTLSSDVTSMESIHSINAIDVTLEGHPVKGIGLSVDDPEMVVGSQKTVKAKIEGDELFSEYLDTDSLTWSTSNKAIATVDENGVVTVKRKGKVTITATAKDGTTGSITLGGKSGQSSSGGTDSDKPKDDSRSDTKSDGKAENKDEVNAESDDKAKKDLKTVKVNTLTAKEIFIGDEIVEVASSQDTFREEMASDASALEENETYSKRLAAGSAIASIGLCGAGAVFRIRKFHREVK